jgi:hypothetical protein
MSVRRLGGAIVMTIAFMVASEQLAHAQGAWTPPEKSLTADFSYQYVPSTAVVIDPDTSNGNRPSQNHMFLLGATYVPIAKLAIDANLGFGLFKHKDQLNDQGMPIMHVPPGKWDDGKFHSSLTDLRVGARYQLLDEPKVAFSPHIGVTIPVADYEVIGFATGGRHLKTLHVGASLGRSLDPYVPNLYFTGTYEFSISERYDANEKTSDYKQRRSDISAEIGYLFLDGKLGVNLAMNWRIAHGGLSFHDFETPAPDPRIVFFHDPILAEDFLFLGGGVSYEITDRLTAALVVRQFIRGYNTRDQDLYGVNFSFAILQ